MKIMHCTKRNGYAAQMPRLVVAAVFFFAATASWAGPAIAASGVESEDLGPPREGSEGRSERDLRLDDLFDELKAAEDEIEAEATERSILSLWSQSGSPTTDLLMDRAASVGQDGDVALALGLLDAIVELQPGYSEVWYRRGQLYLLNEDLASALNDFQETLALEPRHYPAVIAIADILSALGDINAALSSYRLALELNPHLQEAQEAIADLSYKVEGQGI